jgi:DNA-directed RNA polymerase specialized sigma24 family protein
MVAWRGLGRFEERSSVRAWPHAIAASKCLNNLRRYMRDPHAPSATRTG